MGDTVKEGEVNGELADAVMGQEYLTQIFCNGKIVFLCRLCNCRYDDPVETNWHLKSRNHNALYKELRSLYKQRKLEDETLLKMTIDDRYVLARHAEISPSGQELHHINSIVCHVEYALQSLADTFFEIIKPIKQYAAQTKAEFDDKKMKLDNSEDDCHNQLSWLVPYVAPPRLTAPPPKIDDQGATLCVRELMSVMRVGPLAEGLLVQGERDVRLVVLCHNRPTIALLQRLTENLVHHLSRNLFMFKVEPLPAEAALRVSYGTVNVLVSFTSTAMRKSPDYYYGYQSLLPQEKCLDALAAMRRARWFQATIAPMQSWVSIIRVMRDICRRIPVWSSLSTYMVELLVSSALRGVVKPVQHDAVAVFRGQGLPPVDVNSSQPGPAAQHEGEKPPPALGNALRRVMEALAGGLLLEPERGIRDPCETDVVDALDSLTPQKREDLTASAQLYIRQIAFRQMYKLLDMEPWPLFCNSAGMQRFSRQQWHPKPYNKRTHLHISQDWNVWSAENEVVEGAEHDKIVFDEDYDPKTGVISSLYKEIITLKNEIAESNTDMATVKTEIIVIDDDSPPVKSERSY